MLPRLRLPSSVVLGSRPNSGISCESFIQHSTGWWAQDSAGGHRCWPLWHREQVSDNLPRATLTKKNPLAFEVWVAALENPWGSHFLPRAYGLAETCERKPTLDDLDLGSSPGEHPSLYTPFAHLSWCPCRISSPCTHHATSSDQ